MSNGGRRIDIGSGLRKNPKDITCLLIPCIAAFLLGLGMWNVHCVSSIFSILCKHFCLFVQPLLLLHHDQSSPPHVPLRFPNPWLCRTLEVGWWNDFYLVRPVNKAIQLTTSSQDPLNGCWQFCLWRFASDGKPIIWLPRGSLLAKRQMLAQQR